MLKKSINLVPNRPAMYQAKMVFYLFLASLGMFFFASLLTYLIIRNQAFRPDENAVPNSIATMGPEIYQSLELPVTFWISTLILVLVSVFLQRACWLIHREKQVGFRRWLIWAMLAAAVFVFVQAIGMNDLLNHHFSQTDGSTKVYGMSYTLSFIHALHVLGGIIFLGFVIRQAFQEKYDHERHWAVDHCASYWHFLDVVWACMLITFVVA
ncbi:MAG: cytochrome c oxidase subunit 3 [Mariniblastus sp.]|nr:cytochrome c oxidase subunit 3 [Mariniblastus sp.]